MDVTLTNSVMTQLNRGKRRKMHIDNWKQNVRKRRKDSGDTYVSSRNLPKESLKRPDERRVCKCSQTPNGCIAELLVGKHQTLFQKFRELSYDGQSQYLSQAISIEEPKRKYTINNIQVCKSTLCYIFSITQRRVQYLVDKIESGADVTDKRGKRMNRPKKLKLTDKEKICEHIKSFPQQENHYSRNASSKNCLSADLSISKMYRLFLEKYPDCQISLRTYHDVFKSKFNLCFELPRSDTCSYCDKLFMKLYSTDDERERREIENESKIHHMRAESGYQTLREDTAMARINPNYVVLCTDLQQVLFCQNLTHSSIFYQRQFSTYNYCVHNMGNTIATMMLWHEVMAHRGSTEIASTLLLYITQNFHRLGQGQERKIVVWSDRSVGQNNNWKMITLLRLLLREKYFTQVEQKFLVSGHSFLPCDRDFALIERIKKLSSVYVPFQWTDVIAKSKVSNPFTVIYMHQTFFKDFTDVENSILKDPKCKITQGVWIQITSDDPNSIRIRKSDNTVQHWFSYSLKSPKKTTIEVTLDDLREAYEGPLPIKKEKLANLLHMCDYIPLKYINFYQNIRSDA